MGQNKQKERSSIKGTRNRDAETPLICTLGDPIKTLIIIYPQRTYREKGKTKYK